MQKMVYLLVLLLNFSGCTKEVEGIYSYNVPSDYDKPNEDQEYSAKDIVISARTVVNQDDAVRVRNRIMQGIEPQASAFKALITDANSALNFNSNPPEHMDIMGGYQTDSNLGAMRNLMERESIAAYSTALAWLYTGKNIYAFKSTQILRSWAEKGTTFSGKDAGLQLGSWFNQILYALDILKEHPDWTSEDHLLFRDWWYREALSYLRDAMTKTNNWGDAGLLGVLTTAVVFDDQDLLDEGLKILDSYFGERLGNPDWKFANKKIGVYLPEEVTRNDGVSGITYTAYALTSMVQALEIARYNGHDYWHRVAENGATMKGVIENYFRWNELGETFPWHPDPAISSSRKNPFELANNYFPGEIRGMKVWLNSNRPVRGHQGDQYITLNRGELPPLEINK